MLRKQTPIDHDDYYLAQWVGETLFCIDRAMNDIAYTMPPYDVMHRAARARGPGVGRARHAATDTHFIICRSREICVFDAMGFCVQRMASDDCWCMHVNGQAVYIEYDDYLHMYPDIVNRPTEFARTALHGRKPYRVSDAGLIAMRTNTVRAQWYWADFARLDMPIDDVRHDGLMLEDGTEATWPSSNQITWKGRSFNWGSYLSPHGVYSGVLVCNDNTYMYMPDRPPVAAVWLARDVFVANGRCARNLQSVANVDGQKIVVHSARQDRVARVFRLCLSPCGRAEHNNQMDERVITLEDHATALTGRGIRPAKRKLEHRVRSLEVRLAGKPAKGPLESRVTALEVLVGALWARRAFVRAGLTWPPPRPRPHSESRRDE